MLDCGRGLNSSSIVAGSGSFLVVVFVVIRGRSWAFVANRVITDTRFWYKYRGIIAENHFRKENFSEAHHGLCPETSNC